MATVGIKLVKIALVDPATQKLISGEEGLSETGIYEIDNKDLGTKSANITGLAGSITTVYGNNTSQRVSTGAPAPSVALDVNGLDFGIKQRIKGLVPDGKGGWSDNKTPAHVAMLVQTQSWDRKTNIYFGFGNGMFTEAGVNAETDDSAEHVQDDVLTYTALDTIAFDHKSYKLYADNDDKFDEGNMLKEVFGGFADPKAPAQTGDTTGAGETSDPA